MDGQKGTAALKKHIAEEAHIGIHKDAVVIGEAEYRKDAKSAYANARGTPYTLGAIALLYITKEQDHGEYMAQCRENGVDAVSFVDRDRILADLAILPVEEHIKTRIMSRVDGLTVETVVKRYTDIQKENEAELRYIVTPKQHTTETEAIRRILLQRDGLVQQENEIRYGKHRYILQDTPQSIDRIEKIAAVFVDGSIWQFKDWPEEIVERMKVTPVFYLFAENVRTTLPSLPASVVVLKVTLDDAASMSLVSSAIWSILGHNHT